MDKEEEMTRTLTKESKVKLKKLVDSMKREGEEEEEEEEEVMEE